jgi:hypothetical protein
MGWLWIAGLAVLALSTGSAPATPVVTDEMTGDCPSGRRGRKAPLLNRAKLRLAVALSAGHVGLPS